MHMDQGVTRRWLALHPKAKESRDAVISFECLSPDLVQVCETIDGECLQKQAVQRHHDIVTELEKRYIFFADEAEIARKLIGRGRSCSLSVYFRQP